MKFDYNENIKIIISPLKDYNSILIFTKTNLINNSMYLKVAEGVVKENKINWTYIYKELKENIEKDKIINFAEKIILNISFI